MKFQSTPPVKAATPIYVATAVLDDISIHAAREGGDLSPTEARKRRMISIHAAREGGDLLHVFRRRGLNGHFNPRRP